MTPDFGSAVDPAMESDFLRDLYNTARYVRFGPFHIDQNRQQVFRNGVRLRLQGKVYQVLIVLLHKQGEVVTREELKQALWPADTHVNYDANVNTTVNKLRQALGESTEKPTYIETIPRKGYSFISTAEFSAVPFPAAAPEKSHQAESGSVEHANQSAQAGRPASRRGLTLIVVALILAGILLGAGVASYWISHFAPQFRHSSTRRIPCASSSKAC
jgi:DNA-binding winged helix-turn-helix (wHTH) protein